MAENTQQLRPLIISELQPPMNITVVKDSTSLQKMADFLEKKSLEPSPMVGLDTETNVVEDFWFRRVRTIQVGDKEQQFVIDLLAFAGSEESLIASQGQYGATNGDTYKTIMDVLRPVLCTGDWLKIGQNLGFEYSVFSWNFGMRIWNLYSTDMAERVIQAGTIPLRKMAMFSMSAIAARHFQLIIDKTNQTSFDLRTPLTQEQLEYAAFDVRFPFSMRQAQVNIMTADQLLATTQIENDAIGTYTDMHLTGQNLDDERWLLRIKHTIERRQGELKILDEGFLPIVGDKDKQIDQAEIDRRYKHWKEDFEVATPAEMALAASKREEKDKIKKSTLGELLKVETKKRTEAKQAARAAYSELSKKKTVYEKNYTKCEGQAYINYDSQIQLLAALQKMPGMRSVQDTTDYTLLKFNDQPLIQTLRKFKKGKKETGTYGVTWTQKWITKCGAKEGWRHPGDGRLHCTFNQLLAETGRSSSSKPNAQNLPQDKEVRECFIADPPDSFSPEGYDIITIDLSGAELRIIAELAQAKSWIMAFAKGQDVHSVSTEILYPEKWPALKENGCAYYALDEKGEPQRKKCKCKGHSELRNHTKAVNFLLCYGGGPDALADAIGVSTDAAKEIMKLHESKFGDIWSYLKRSGELAQADKQARDMYGRRRSFPIPTWEIAKEWYESENAEKLELSEEVQEQNLFNFKATNLRETTKEEEYKLTHRSPDAREIKYAIRALMGSISRMGKNMPIQGTNASLMKRSMGCGFDKNGKGFLWHLLPQYGAKILSMIHDELLIQSPKRHSREVAGVVQDAFLRAGQEIMKSVRMESEYHIGPCWEK